MVESKLPWPVNENVTVPVAAAAPLLTCAVHCELWSTTTTDGSQLTDSDATESTSTLAGRSRPVSDPWMVAGGVVSRVAPGAYSVIVLAYWLATYRAPVASVASPVGPSRPVSAPEITLLGLTAPFEPGGY